MTYESRLLILKLVLFCFFGPCETDVQIRRVFCDDCSLDMLDLSSKKCVPCNAKDLRPMTEEAAHNLIPQVSLYI